MTGNTSWPSARQAWTTTFILALASMFAQFDRAVFNLNTGPIKAAYALSDTQFAVLQSVAFGAFYVVCAPLIGRLVDRFDRRRVLGWCLFFFSVASMASGFARNFWQMFITRMGVGIGEASVTPASLSILSDSVPPERLGRTISAFLISAPLGVGLGFVAGGWALGLLDDYAKANGLPFGLEPWQASFLIISLPGLILTPFVLLMREPARQGQRADNPLSVTQVIDVMRERRTALAFLFAGFCMQAIMNFAYNIWTPALFERVYGWDKVDIGIYFGLIMISFGVAGVWFAGWMSDRMGKTGKLDAHLRLSAAAAVGFGICGTLAPLMPTATGAFTLIAIAMFLISMPVPCVGIALQLILPNRARGQVSGLYYLVNGMMGLVVGPLLIGFMNDNVFTGPTDIRYSLATVVGVSAPVMCLLLLLGLKPYRELRTRQAEGERL